MIYLDNAATSFPKPESVYASMDRILREVGGNPGRASHRMALEASRVVFEARERVAELLGVTDSARVAFTKNATEAINIALKGLLRPGDHLVTSSFEHNSMARTITRLQSEGVEVTWVEPGPDGILDPDEVASAAVENTALVAVTHASNVFGTLQPVEDIGRRCREKGVLFMTDAAQTAGAVPIDLGSSSIDILAATGHKALFGPQGTGFLYLREGVEPGPLIDGGTGEPDTVLELPERLEAGTMNMPGIGGLGSGAEYLLAEGVEKVRAHELVMIERLLSGLEKMDKVRVVGSTDPEKRVSLVSFTIEGTTPAEAGRALDDDFGIMVRTGTHCAPMAHRQAGTFPDGTIRVSPGYLNTLEDVEAFLKAAAAMAA